VDADNFKNDEYRWKLLKFKLLETQIVEIITIFRKNEIEPILIKGWAAGLYYPNQFERIFSDIDLAVAPGDFEKADALVISQNLTVDLHCGFRKHDTVDWSELFNKSLLEKIDAFQVRVLRPEDHLRVLCVHWLADGGIYKDKLKDIYYLIEKNRDNFDWNDCLNTVEPKRRKWIISTIGLVHRYFGLNIDDLSFKEEIQNIPSWMIDTVEKEWKNPLPLRPLQTCLNDKKMLFRQIKKRIPPNSIQATIEMNGEFDGSSRIKYQILNMFFRIKPSVKRVFNTFLTGKKY